MAEFELRHVLHRQFEVPVLVSTMVTFGDPNMSTPYITSGRIEALLNRPVSPSGRGNFAVETLFRGIPQAFLA